MTTKTSLLYYLERHNHCWVLACRYVRFREQYYHLFAVRTHHLKFCFAIALGPEKYHGDHVPQLKHLRWSASSLGHWRPLVHLWWRLDDKGQLGSPSKDLPPGHHSVFRFSDHAVCALYCVKLAAIIHYAQSRRHSLKIFDYTLPRRWSRSWFAERISNDSVLKNVYASNIKFTFVLPHWSQYSPHAHLTYLRPIPSSARVLDWDTRLASHHLEFDN